MDKLIKDALDWFAGNWQTAICGSTDAARFLQIKPNTLKTRLARGQALAFRIPGNVRDSVEFTGYQLTYNLIQHVLIRHRFNFAGLETGDCEQIKTWCAAVEEDILKPPYDGDAVFRVVERDEIAIAHYYPDGEVMATTGEPALIIPIGTMMIRMAVDLYMRKRAG